LASPPNLKEKPTIAMGSVAGAVSVASPIVRDHAFRRIRLVADELLECQDTQEVKSRMKEERICSILLQTWPDVPRKSVGGDLRTAEGRKCKTLFRSFHLSSTRFTRTARPIISTYQSPIKLEVGELSYQTPVRRPTCMSCSQHRVLVHLPITDNQSVHEHNNKDSRERRLLGNMPSLDHFSPL
jgi:hypothetical protein